MKTELERLEECKVALKIEIPVNRVTRELDTLYLTLQKKAELPGFRRGKIPPNILRTHFKSSARADALDRLISQAYHEALKENDIIPCSKARIENVKYEENEPLSFRATVEVKPKIILKGYKELKAKKFLKIIKEEDINRALQKLQHRQAEFIPVTERPTEEGDWVIVDFVGTIEGKPFENNKAKNFSLEIGSKTLLADFEDQLVGLKKGEEKEIKVTFSGDYHNKELAGKEVLFKVNLKEIKKKELPKVDNEFAKDLKFSNLEELKRKIKKDLERYEKEHSERVLRNDLMDWLIKKTPFSAPEAMVERELEAMIEEALIKVRYSGVDPKRMGIEETKLRKEYRPNAERKVKSTLILEQIGREEGIEVNEEEIEKRIEELALSTRQKKEVLSDFFNKDKSHLAGLQEEIRIEKALDFMVREARIKEVRVKKSRSRQDAKNLTPRC